MNLATMQSARPPGLPQTQGRRTIPFDYSFRFILTGTPETTHSKTVTISIESSFTAVSIGYGAVPTIEPIRFGLLPPRVAEPPTATSDALLRIFATAFGPRFTNLQPGTGAPAPTSTANPNPSGPGPAPVLPSLPTAPTGTGNPLFGGAGVTPGPLATTSPGIAIAARPTLRQFAQRSFFSTTIAALADRLGEPINPNASTAIGPRTAAALRNGIKLTPELSEQSVLALEGSTFDDSSLAEAFQAVSPPTDQIQFLYALSDQGTNREFQSEPVLSTAGLGAADGGRPFRYFAMPIEFSPLSVIRLQITEKSDFVGELHVTLQGYKTLGGVGSPTAIEGRRVRRRVRR